MAGEGSAKHPKSETNTRIRPRESPTPARTRNRVIDLCPSCGYKTGDGRLAFPVPGLAAVARALLFPRVNKRPAMLWSRRWPDGLAAERWTRDFLQFLGRDRVWDDLANRRPRAWPDAAAGAARQRLRSVPWRAFHARTRPFSSFGRGRTKTPDHADRMLRFARIAGGHLRGGPGRTLYCAQHSQSRAALRAEQRFARYLRGA